MIENSKQADPDAKEDLIDDSSVELEMESSNTETESDSFVAKESSDGSIEDLTTLRVKITELEELVAKNWDKAVRATSELENVRKRSDRELAKAHKFAIEGFVKSLLPVIDSLEQACDIDTSDDGHLKEGLELTLKLLVDTFDKHGVERLDPKGEVFDPTLHEAMSTQQDPDLEPGTVVTVFQKGYQLSGRVIRPARVIVAAK